MSFRGSRGTKSDIDYLWPMQFSPLNFLALIAGVLVNFLVGVIWYAPYVFGRSWQKHTGMTNDKFKRGNVIMRIAPSLVLTFAMGLVLALFLPPGLNWEQGAFAGLIMGAGVGAAPLALHYMYARRSVNLFLIDAGYGVLMMAIFGAIIAAMS
jgi:hypothetical protein